MGARGIQEQSTRLKPNQGPCGRNGMSAVQPSNAAKVVD